MSDSIAVEMEVIKKHHWIDSMGQRYLDIWTELVNRYAVELNKAPIKKETGYTQHDFSHHCKDIYQIIENVFLHGVTIEEEEYFVLAVAVLMHDISMTKLHFDRLSHSQQSVDYIEEEIKNGVDIWNDLNSKTIGAIEQVICAHSDIKERDLDGKEKIKKHTLRETDEKIMGEARELHVRWLAGILRLADELDVTVDRKGVADKRYEELSDEDQDESYSKRCWKQLNYFESVEKKKTVIEVGLHKRYLTVHLNDDRANIISEIRKIRKKIYEQLCETNEYAFNYDEEYIQKIKLTDVRIRDNGVGLRNSELGEDLGKENIYDEKILNRVESDEEIGIGFEPEEEETDFGGLEENENNKFSVGSGDEIEETTGTNVEKSDSSEKEQKKPLHLREELGKEITKFVYDNELIDYGHYRLNRRLCAEKWIDVRAVLSDVKMSRKITKIISRDLKAYLDNKRMDVQDILLVGVSMNGNILASRVAFLLGTAFTYIVPAKPGMGGTDIEKKTRIDQTKKIILFTGAISSYDTITRVIKEHFAKTEILRIYTVFWREVKKEYQMPEILENIKRQIETKVIYLNDDFPCEVLEHEKCIRRKYGDCIAKNSKAYEEIYEWPLAVKDNVSNRVFINNIIGCVCECQYCYLKEVGIQKVDVYSAEEVIAEFERLHDVSPQKTIISFGCYSECMEEGNLLEMDKLIRYFAVKGYYIQIPTKKKINSDWLKKIEKYLIKEAQLNIFISMPTLQQAEAIEPRADCVDDRIMNFEYCSKDRKIEFYMYIKPFLDDITFIDIERYVLLQNKYKMKIVVGNRFQFESKEGEKIRVGKDEMCELNSGHQEKFVERLMQAGRVYGHSTDPVREKMYAAEEADK